MPDVKRPAFWQGRVNLYSPGLFQPELAESDQMAITVCEWENERWLHPKRELLAKAIDAHRDCVLRCGRLRLSRRAA